MIRDIIAIVSALSVFYILIDTIEGHRLSNPPAAPAATVTAEAPKQRPPLDCYWTDVSKRPSNCPTR